MPVVSKKRILFEELHPDELETIKDEGGLVFLPLGTLEWHERHLPFGLDALVSFEICRRLCLKTGGCVIPPLYFGTDREHSVGGRQLHGMDARAGRVLPGSIYFLKPSLFYELLRSVATNVWEQGFRKLVVVSAHSGTAQQEALYRLAKEKFDNMTIRVFPGKEFAGGIDHAGRQETALMLAVRPELVRLSDLVPPYEAILGEDPLLATRREGSRHLNRIVNEIRKKLVN